MKKLLLFMLCLCSTMLFSQTVTLSKMSDKKIISYQTLYDREGDDIYGYLFVFEKDKIERKEYLYEYTLFDKNLNKVLDGNFTEKIGRWASKIQLNAIYRDGYITFKINDDLEMSYFFIRTKYRILDIKNNTLSDAFSFNRDLEKTADIESESLKQSISYSFDPTNSGYYINGPLLTNSEKGYTKMQIGYSFLNDSSLYNKLYYTNAKLEPQWTFSYNENSNAKQYDNIYIYNLKNNTDLLLGLRYYKGKNNYKLWEKGQLFDKFIFLEKKTGKLVNEFSPYGINTIEGTKVKELSTASIFMESNEKLTLINNLMREKEKGYRYNSEKLIGYSKAEYDIKSGKLINHYMFTWNQIAEYLPVNEFGYVKEKGEPNSFLYLHDALKQNNGNILFVFEQYKPLKGSQFQGAGIKINDLIFVELDAKMKLVTYKRIAKQETNKRNPNGLVGLAAAQYYDVFDYSGYQDLGDNKYTFFYFNKQKPEDGGKKQNVLGILQFDNGKITEEKLNLKSNDNSELSILPAKKGYILIHEHFNSKSKNDELRLEKIN